MVSWHKIEKRNIIEESNFSTKL
jgi:hypothetical protein